MIQIEILKKVNHIVTHENCADGLASAMILRQVYQDAKVTFCQYGTKELAELPAEPGILFCDMSPPLGRAVEFQAARSIVLDHHKQIKNMVLEFQEMGLGYFADEEKEPGVSGSVLAFTKVLRPMWEPTGSVPDIVIRQLAYLVGIRDTWQRQDPLWYSACNWAAGLKFYGEKRCLEGSFYDWWDIPHVGAIVVENAANRLKKTLEGAHRFTTSSGTRVVLFEGLSATSDAAELIGEEADLVVGFGCWQGDDGNLGYVYSCRSHTNFDCGAFCKQMGGGGHTKAAGFRDTVGPDTANPWANFRNHVLGPYEGRQESK